MYLSQDMGDFTFINTFEERDGKSPTIQLAFNQDIRASSSPDNGNLLQIVWKEFVCQVVVYQCHIAGGISDCVQVCDRGWYFDAGSGQNLLDYNFFPPFFLVMASLDKTSDRVLCSREVVIFDLIFLRYL